MKPRKFDDSYLRSIKNSKVASRMEKTPVSGNFNCYVAKNSTAIRHVFSENVKEKSTITKIYGMKPAESEFILTNATKSFLLRTSYFQSCVERNRRLPSSRKEPV